MSQSEIVDEREVSDASAVYCKPCLISIIMHRHARKILELRETKSAFHVVIYGF